MDFATLWVGVLGGGGGGVHLKIMNEMTVAINKIIQKVLINEELIQHNNNNNFITVLPFQYVVSPIKLK